LSSVLDPIEGETAPVVDRGSIFFVGTATVLLKYGGLVILTDPNFLHRGTASVNGNLGAFCDAERQTNPAITFEELPEVDLILLSHYHEDHFDKLVEEKLSRSIPIISTPHACDNLSAVGFSAVFPLQTWESVLITKGNTKLLLTSMPGKHAPTPLSVIHALPPVMGTMLEFGVTQRGAHDHAENFNPLFRMYISGDTLVHADLKEIPKRFPDIDLGLFHLGGTKILGILVTMDAKQGVRAVQIINARTSIPIHYNDYNVFKSPLDDFKIAVMEAGLQDRVVYIEHGETYNFVIPGNRMADIMQEKGKEPAHESVQYRQAQPLSQ